MMDELEINFKTISSKLDGIPKIIYLNDNQHLDKKMYMENQFKSWGIKDYKRHEKKYKEETYNEWKDLVLDDNLVQSPSELALTLNTINSVIEWYDSNESEICIFMEDNIKFDAVNNWLFDWNLLMKNLPYNWDCIQFFSSAERKIKMHLHPWESDSGSCHCYMISRYFAKRLKHYHYKDGKFLLHYHTPDKSIPDFEYGGLHNFFYNLGITYTLPIFSLNEEFIGSDTVNDLVDKLSSEAIDYWWSIRSKSYSSFEFFHYNKNDEWRMEVMFDISTKKPYVFKDKSEGLLLWI
ncbi:hypothetical protein EB155_04585 [archaeon]|jgi:hypothetical protein|nr:hypothetical protein [archaeon]NDB79124.1 hypothetical protein [archaeon]